MAKEVLNKILKGAGLMFLGMIFSKFITYFYRIVVARYIGPDAYGQLALGLTVLGIATTLSQLGLNQGVQKFVPEARKENDKAKLKGILLSSIQIVTISSLIVGIAIYTSAEFIATEIFGNAAIKPIIQVFAFVPLASKIGHIYIDLSNGFNTMKYEVLLVRIIQPVVQLVATLILAFTGMKIMAATWGWFIGEIIIMPLAVILIERKFGPFLFSDIKARKMHKELLTYSYPLVLSGVVGTALGWGDTALLGYFMSDKAVGFYNAALPTALLVTLPAQAISSLSLPSFSELGVESSRKQQEALKITTRWVFSLAFPAFLLIALFPEKLMILLFGSQYSTASTALAILAFGNLIGSSTGQLGSFLKSNSNTKIVFWNTSANLIFNLGLNVILIPIYGIEGAAIATAASTIFIETILLIEVYRLHGAQPFSKKMLYSIPAGITSLVITYAIFKIAFNPTPVWVLFPAGIVFMTLYMVIFLKTGGLTEYDEKIVKTSARKIGLEKEAEKTLSLLT